MEGDGGGTSQITSSPANCVVEPSWWCSGIKKLQHTEKSWTKSTDKYVELFSPHELLTFQSSCGACQPKTYVDLWVFCQDPYLTDSCHIMSQTGSQKSDFCSFRFIAVWFPNPTTRHENAKSTRCGKILGDILTA